MPTWLERQRQRADAILKKDVEQHDEAEKMDLALRTLWQIPAFMVLLTLLDRRFDPERYLVHGDEHERRMAADYWKIRREMEHKRLTVPRISKA